jgi:GNAT superfamily N-acetyltransferase
MNIQIRLAVSEDAASIKSFDEFAGSRHREIEAESCLVALIDDQVVAYASCEPHGLLGQPLLTFLCVRPEFRRRGLATELVKAVQFRARGRKLLSSTEDWCTGTQRIFERLGWKKVGEISGVNKDGSSEWFYAIQIET